MTNTDRIEISNRLRKVTATPNSDGTFRVASYLLGIRTRVIEHASAETTYTMLMF